ncbi:hypothetical protein JCM6882_009663 [Rhodosporidiobolus microsporus]
MHLSTLLPLLALSPLVSSLPLSRRQASAQGYPLPLAAVGPLSDIQDPSVCVGPTQTLYLLSSGEGLPVRTSSDGGSTWSAATSLFPDELPDSVANCVAEGSSTALQGPDCTYFNETGEFAIVFSASKGTEKENAVFAVTTADPLSGNWTDKGLVLESTAATDYNAVSPHLVDVAGFPLYLSIGGNYSALRMTALKRSTYKPTSSELINQAVRPDNASIGSPFIFRTETPFSYWLLSTFDDPSISSLYPSTLRIARSTRSLTDPYRAQNGGLMWDGEATTLLASHEGVHNPSSPSVWFEEGEGRWKIAYQYVDDSGRYQLGLNYLDFETEDGWPVLA